jgi:hypothetical protein
MGILPTVKLVLRVSQEPNDGIWWEKGSLRSLEKGEGVEEGDGREIGGCFMGYLINRYFEGINDSLDFSISVVDRGFGAVVQFHGELKFGW